MPASAVFAPAAILAAIASAAPRPDADVAAPPDDMDVAGAPDPEERRMLEFERAIADAELDAICAAMDESAIEDLPEECLEAIPEIPSELVLCLAPDEVLFEGMAI